MVELVYQEERVTLQSGESVLEALERSGKKIPNSCRQGLCHACMMQSSHKPPAQAQQGLSDLQSAQDYFLACCCYPNESMQVDLISNESRVPAQVCRTRKLNESVLELSLQADVRWQPGQTVLLWKDDHTCRPYSIASHPHRDGSLNLHIRRHAQGEVSRWCHDQLTEGQVIQISSPEGGCVYDPHDMDKPMLMVSTGTGLAPLYGLVQQALAEGHQGRIDLYAAAGDISGLYLRSELEQLVKQYSQFHYHPVIKRGDASGILEGDVVDLVSQRHGSLRGTKIFLCGSPDMISRLNRQCFMAGANRNDIVADAFVSVAPRHISGQ